MAAHVQVAGLEVLARGAAGADVPIVRDVGFSVAKGEVLALIGESGSGKTTIALALMGYVRAGCRISGGTVQVGGTSVLELPEHELRHFRGARVAYIAQSAAAAFNPARTIMEQVVEGVLVHGLMRRADAERKAVELFEALALPQPDRLGQRYPHQVSGGQLQRLMAAMALISDPALVILDEPTTALDVTTQIEVLRAFKSIVRDRGTTAVYVSHDLGVVSQMADRIVVLRRGEIRECGTTEQILHAPADDYTRELMAAARPAARAADAASGPSPALLEVRGLHAGYGRPDRTGMPRHLVLHDVGFTLQRGQSLGVIGESGSGKSTLARVIAGLLPPARGQVRFAGEPLPGTLDGRSREQFRRIQLVFQNADTALNPAHTVGRVLERPLTFYHGLKGQPLQRRIAELLELVRLPASLAHRPSSELSGGQKQRVSLARALAAGPDLILCDEVTSALDTVVGAAILEVLADLRRALNVSYLFISHDISTVRAVCDDVVVLYAGRKVEVSSGRDLLRAPAHPYTDLLVSSVPQMRRGWLEEASARRLRSDAAGSMRPVPAAALCTFLPRCALRDQVCERTYPAPRLLTAVSKEILCHRTAEELARAAAYGPQRP